VLGEEIAQPVNEWQNAGHHQMIFDGKTLPNGIYFSQLRFNVWQDIKKMLILK